MKYNIGDDGTYTDHSGKGSISNMVMRGYQKERNDKAKKCMDEKENFLETENRSTPEEEKKNTKNYCHLQIQTLKQEIEEVKKCYDMKLSLILSFMVITAMVAVVTLTRKPRMRVKKVAIGLGTQSKCVIVADDNHKEAVEKVGENVLLCDLHWNESPEIINLGGTDRYAVDVAVGSEHACAIANDNTLFCWGLNNAGQLGIGTTTNNRSKKFSPQVIKLGAGQFAKKIAVGNHYSCVITNSNEVLCWGESYRQHYNSPTKVVNTGPTNGEYAIDISIGSRFSCLITNKGTLKCWGSFMCVIANDGFQKCWGPNPSAVFVARKEGASPLEIPTAIDLGNLIENGKTFQLHAIKLATSDSRVCVITNHNNLLCWGDNKYGQVGDGKPASWVPTPTSIHLPTDENVENVALGTFHTCATTRSLEGVQKVFCWGNNSVGQVGDGTTINRYTPTTVKIRSNENIESLTLDNGGSYAITDSSHTLLVWGFDYWSSGHFSSRRPTLIDFYSW